MSGLFLSYARADDEDFVRWLYNALTADGFTVWFDRTSMPSRSLTFLHEIRAAIDGIDRVLAVVGPAALKSEYVRAEWQHALAAEKVVVPVLRGGEYTDLPAELGSLHVVDFRPTIGMDHAYAQLRRVLKDPIPPLGALHGNLPGLPPHFQPRPDDFARVAETVLADLKKPITIAGPAALVVIHGMRGTGKSVIAAAFARSTSARRSFPYGVFWLAVGEEADGLAIARRLGAMLPGYRGSYASVEEAKTTLTQQLAGKRALVVLDDVRSVDQIEVLSGVSDVNTRVVATTTDAELVVATGGREIQLRELTEEAALRLLADWFGCAIELLPPDAVVLARECGYHPLALALNGAMLKGGTSLSALIEALRAAELHFADVRLVFYPHPTVRQSLQVSMDSLIRRDPFAAERFRELAALRWFDSVPEAAVSRLWQYRANLADRGAVKLISQLEQRALVRTEGTAPDRRVRIHGLQLSYLREPPTDLIELNRIVVAAYEDVCSGNWAAGPADGYFHQNLMHHLASSGLGEQVHRLLAVEGKGQNAWFQAKADLGLVASYFDDIDLALALVPNACKDDVGQRVALCTRYALIKTSIQSQAKSIPPGLLELCVQNEVLRFPAALSFARAGSLEEQRVAALVGLIPLVAGLRAELESEALDVALSVDEPSRQVSMLAPLIPLLSPPQASRAFASVRRLENDRDLSALIAKLAGLVPPHDFDDLLIVVLGLPDSVDKVHALVVAAKHPGAQIMLGEADAVATRLTDPGEKVRALALVAAVPAVQASRGDVLIETALATLRAIEGSDDLAEALATIAPLLFGAQFDTALELASWTANDDGHVRALFGIVPFLEEARRNEIVTQQIELHQPKPGKFPWGEPYFAILASDLPEPRRAEILPGALTSIVRMATLPSGVFNTPRAMRSRTWLYHAALEVLARRLPAQYVTAAIDAVLRVRDAEDRAELLRCLAPRLSATDRVPVLRAEFARVLRISDAVQTASTLAALSQWAPKSERRELAKYCLKLIDAEGGRASPEVTAAIARHLRPKHARAAIRHELSRIAAIERDNERDWALAAFAPGLGPAEISRAADIARTTLDGHRYRALATLAGSLEPDDRQLAVEQILSVASGWVALELPKDFAQALHFTVRWMSSKQVKAAFKIANKVAEQGHDDFVYAEMVCSLAPKLSAPQVETVRKNVDRLKNPAAQVVAWAALANVPGVGSAERQAFVDNALRASASVAEPARSARALRILASVGESERPRIMREALDAARRVAEDDERARVLCELLDVLPRDDGLAAFGEMATASLGVRHAGSYGGNRFYEGLGRPFLLARLGHAAPWLGSFDDPGCVSGVVGAVRDVVRWWP